MSPGYFSLKSQCSRITEAVKLFRVASIDELSKCLIFSPSMLNTIIKHHCSEIKRTEVPTKQKTTRYIYFIDDFDKIKDLIIKKYGKIYKKAGIK